MPMTPLLWVAVALVITIAGTELLRRAPPRWAAAGLLLVPALATPQWLAAGAPSFSVVKVYSVVVAALYIQALRLRPQVSRCWQWAGTLLLAANMLEAVVTEWLRVGWPNAVAGLLLVAAMAPPSAIQVGPPPWREVRYPLGVPWILAYSLWNLVFVYGDRPEFTAFALVHVLAPLLAGGGRADRWIQARTAALALLMMVRMSAPQPPWLVRVPEWHHPDWARGLAWLSLAVAAAVALQSGWRRASADGPRKLLGALLARRRERRALDAAGGPPN
ncbi:MAG: hypothetical protein HY902_00240 [Deltaproteobacteria bacterium]|nr:hypothetical protein [Deltaproteobacteria bacterium]